MMFWRRRREQDLDREIRDHLELEAEEQDRRALGNVALIKENVREAWGWMWLDRLCQDLRYGCRTLRKSPAFAATAVLSLALGIGASTAIFSLIDALLLRWLPVRNPQELLQLTIAGAPERGPFAENFSYPLVKALEPQGEIFEGLCGFTGGRFPTGPRDSVEDTNGAWVTGGFYETLGLQPAAGRLLTPDDDKPGAVPAAVIGYGYWERKYGRDSRIIGQPIQIFGKPVIVVGVTPAGFTGANVGQIADVTLPLAVLPQLQPDEPYMIDASSWWIRVVARPQPGISRDQVKARLRTIWPNLAESAIPANMPGSLRRVRGTWIELRPGGTGWTDLRRQFRQPLYVLMALTGLVLLIACANVANLLLARATARQKEITMRFALGAGRLRIVRQMLTESLLLSVCGATLGVALAWAGSRFLLSLLSSGQARALALDVAPNWHVLGAAMAAAVGSAVVFGLVSSGAKGARRKRSAAPLLVIAQVAFSLILLIGAGLFVRTLKNLRGLDPGFQREGILLVALDGSKLGYRDARLAGFYGELRQRIETLHGVESASFSAITPLSGGGISNHITIGGKAIDRDQTEVIPVSAGYFETMRTPVLLGREFTIRDDASAPRVAMVNQAFAARYLPDGHPLGRRLGVGTVSFGNSEFEVVGVVRDSIYESLREAPPPTVFVPMVQRIGRSEAVYEVRARGSLAQVASALRTNLQPMLPGAPVEIHTFDAQVEQMLVEERLMASLAASFGSLGLVLAVIGLYGLLAYTVARRTSEIGIRMALGADGRRVVAMVMKQAAALMLAGVAIGVPSAFALTRLTQSLLFGLSARDPATFFGAAIVLAAAALLAGFWPARRASKVDPMTALRCE
jgi:putative ABC transport system permease protein